MNFMRQHLSIYALFVLIFSTLDRSVCWAQGSVEHLSAPHDASQHVVFMLWQGNPDVQRCGVCHYSPGNEFAKRETDFCRLTELRQWLERDKHAIARQRVEPIDPQQSKQATERLRRVIQQAGGASTELPADWIGASNYLSYAICQQMGYDVATETGYTQFRDNCMTCHGGYQAAHGSEGFTRDSSNNPGLSCNYCHQVGTDNRWIDQHSSVTAKSNWRTLTPQVKAAQGMRDLVSAESQARLCLSCHMGDLQQNKFVTHQMYAAGHPPLPSIELSTLIEAMPRHWRTQAELAESLMDAAQRTEYFLNTFPALRRLSEQSSQATGKPVSLLPADLSQLSWQTETLVGGALVAQQQWLRLVSQAAELNDAERVVAWGDYALYDCAACHHELRLPSYRQTVRRAGAPGRPRLLEWPQSLARAIGLTSSLRETLLAQEQQLSQAVLERPFGNRQAIQRSAAALSDTIEKLAIETADRLWTKEFNFELLKALSQPAEEMLLDYHTARQLIWSLRQLDAEMARIGQAAPESVRQRIAKLGQAPATKTDFATSLPGGLGQAIFPEVVQQELDQQASYDGKVFSRQLQDLADAIRVAQP